jgi:hypothetical protein
MVGAFSREDAMKKQFFKSYGCSGSRSLRSYMAALPIHAKNGREWGPNNSAAKLRTCQDDVSCGGRKRTVLEHCVVKMTLFAIDSSMEVR